MSGKPTVLVTGATGYQGGAVVSELLKSDKVTIRILTRNPESAKAKSLGARGVEVVKGDLEDAASITTALTGCEGAFLMTTFDGPTGVEGETELGTGFIDIAKAVGVKHIVFTSVADAHTKTGVPHFESKYVIEEYLRASGLDYTILRLVVFMDNFPVERSMARYMLLGLFACMMQGKSLKWIAVQDIGWFAARAIEDPEEWKGKAITMAGDDLTMEQVKEAYAKVQGVKPWSAPLPLILLNNVLPTELYIMFTWFRETGIQDIDVAALRKIHPGLLTFEECLRTRQSPST